MDSCPQCCEERLEVSGDFDQFDICLKAENLSNFNLFALGLGVAGNSFVTLTKPKIYRDLSGAECLKVEPILPK